MKNPFLRARLSYIVMISVCVAMYYLYHRSASKLQEQSRKPFGNFTAQQVLQRTRVIYRLLQPDGGAEVMTAEPETLNSKAIGMRRCWNIICQNGMGWQIGYFRWDADTGELLVAYCSPPPGNGTGRGFIDRKIAIRRARRWLEQLGYGAGQDWHITRAPKLQGRSWVLFADKNKRRVEIKMDALTGMLTNATVIQGLSKPRGLKPDLP